MAHRKLMTGALAGRYAAEQHHWTSLIEILGTTARPATPDTTARYTTCESGL